MWATPTLNVEAKVIKNSGVVHTPTSEPMRFAPRQLDKRNLPSNQRANCEIVILQFCRGLIHVLGMLKQVMFTSLRSATSEGNAPFVLLFFGLAVEIPQPRILLSNVSARTLSLFLTSSGSKVPLRSRLASISIGPLLVCTVLRDLPLPRFPVARSSSSG